MYVVRIYLELINTLKLKMYFRFITSPVNTDAITNCTKFVIVWNDSATFESKTLPTAFLHVHIILVDKMFLTDIRPENMNTSRIDRLLF